ncbi:MAG TPA: PAS domain S-box protein [Spirochaetota bacterium]|nr:PAS domain S-box protein [Spirochaetota bacterium]HPC39844.1 PAS domain S-box protein [Spirochaetota bacterium]HPL16466.1 PAS domain S-box protein [Spirochaetota bacterium]HQF08980.1 PAS domain S-box protein [Spirochaetota bacterium]HQH98788.1 PAS domain S-box protein [Spirochaetota bacterium]
MERETKGPTIEELQRRIAQLEESENVYRRTISDLYKSQELYRLLAENSSDVIWAMDLEGRFTYMSPSVTAMIGYTPDELIGAPMQQLIVPEYMPLITEEISRELQKPADQRLKQKILELQEIAKDGSVIDVEVTTTWILNEKGVPVGIQGSTRDIRKRKMALMALEESEERYRALFDRSLDMVFLHDFDGRFIDANGAAINALGYTREEVSSLTLREILGDDQMPAVEAIFKELMETGAQKHPTEFILYKKDGGCIFVETKSFLIYRNRKPYAVQGIGREITERKRMEDELRRHQEKLEAMVQERTAELKEINKHLIREILERKQIESELRISENSLRASNEMINKELESARLIQKALMPKEVPLYPPLAIDYRYLPLEAVGGDYFSFTTLEEGGLGIFIGDVTGHGVPAALFLSLVRTVSNRACRKCGMSPSRYLEMINYEVYRGMPDYYMTALYGLFKRIKDGVTFTFSRGGHPYPILYRRDTDSVEFIRASGNLLGWQENRTFGETSVELRPGDRIFLYTDGIPDTINEEREMLDTSDKTFLDLFRDPAGSTISRKLDSVIDAVTKFRKGAPLVDDIILIGVEMQ